MFTKAASAAIRSRLIEHLRDDQAGYSYSEILAVTAAGVALDGDTVSDDDIADLYDAGLVDAVPGSDDAVEASDRLDAIVDEVILAYAAELAHSYAEQLHCTRYSHGAVVAGVRQAIIDHIWGEDDDVPVSLDAPLQRIVELAIRPAASAA